MPKDGHRLDLDADLDKVAGDFLKDIEAAAKEVKQRKQADAEKDRRNASSKKDRKTSLIIIAAATLVLIFVAYWVVCARQPAQQATVSTPQQMNPKLNIPAATTQRGQQAGPRLRPPTGPSNQRPQRPSNEYDDQPAPQ